MRGSRQILIVAMRSWGELGNLLAARTLARRLTDMLGVADVQVLEAEHYFPRLAETGAAIREITLGDVSPAEKRLRYAEVMRDLDATVPGGLRKTGMVSEVFRPGIEQLGLE